METSSRRSHPAHLNMYRYQSFHPCDVGKSPTPPHPTPVPVGSPSRGGDVAVYVFDKNQPSLPTLLYSVLVSIAVFMTLSTVFHSINSPDNSPPSHSVLPVFFLSALLVLLSYRSLYESLLQPTYNSLWLNGLKTPTN